MIGVTIEWAPNPLRSVVRLDDAGRRILWLRLKLDDFENRLTSASFEIGADWQAKDRDGNPRSLEERVAAALRTIDLEYVLGDEERHGKKIDACIDARLEEYAKDLADEHTGDCTCVPCSCTKCYAEGLLGIDTIAGLGKHSAYKIRDAFETGRTIDEVITRLGSYTPIYLPNPNWPESEWQKHVPRWIEEGKRAHEWLVAYRAAHVNDWHNMCPTDEGRS